MRAVIINSPMGVGKTTIGKYIAEKYEGTAFMDGDWCLDIHPFVGTRETKTMAIDKILHMVDNYRKCSICKMIKKCEWRTQEWLEASLKSLSFFSSLESGIDTSDLTVDIIANMIMC